MHGQTLLHEGIFLHEDTFPRVEKKKIFFTLICYYFFFTVTITLTLGRQFFFVLFLVFYELWFNIILLSRLFFLINNFY